MVHYYLSLATANVNAMSQPNSTPDSGPESAGISGFNAQSQMGLPEVLQMCCLSRRSGQITFRSGESYGYIYIQHGRVLHALCGNTEGEEAIYSMLVWPGGGFSLDEGILPHKKTVEATWEQILFEGARRADLGTLRSPKALGPTITTAEPMAIRMYDSQPKLTITRPDLPEITYNLDQEYTHVGRAQGNEICLPYPSISNRHCIFIHSGPDIVLRDLNSSNGTYVNTEIISETVLRPGDTVQCGVVVMKFEPGVKRPKLTVPEKPSATTREPMGQLKTQADTGTIYFQTSRLPDVPARSRGDGKARDAKEDSAYVKGESAISYDDLPKPEVKKSSLLKVIIIVLIALLPVVAGACYYFLVMNHGGH
jgi:pSer/pThr/pTyr-binding forkhead associated (FHA) protein